MLLDPSGTIALAGVTVKEGISAVLTEEDAKMTFLAQLGGLVKAVTCEVRFWAISSSQIETF